MLLRVAIPINKSICQVFKINAFDVGYDFWENFQFFKSKIKIFEKMKIFRLKFWEDSMTKNYLMVNDKTCSSKKKTFHLVSKNIFKSDSISEGKNIPKKTLQSKLWSLVDERELMKKGYQL